MNSRAGMGILLQSPRQSRWLIVLALVAIGAGGLLVSSATGHRFGASPLARAGIASLETVGSLPAFNPGQPARPEAHA